MERLANHFPLRITIVAVRQPKVADFAAILVVQQHILQLEIPVHNSLAVHELYRRHDLRKEAAPVSLREVPVREHSDEELSMGSELHKDVVIPPNHLEPA